MHQIWKYPISLSSVAKLPGDAEIIHVGSQNEEPVVWASVEMPPCACTKRLCVIGTGWDYSASEWTPVGTVQIGPLVWHLMEMKTG